MYFSNALIRNSGAIAELDLIAPFKSDGAPKPLVIVGANGSGKIDLLSIFADAFIEIAAEHFPGVTPLNGGSRSFFRIVGGRNQRLRTPYSVAALKFVHAGKDIYYTSKSGQVPQGDLRALLKPYQSRMNWDDEGNHKSVHAVPKIDQIFPNGAYAFFPSMRFEVPHWAGLRMLERDPEADFSPRFADRLEKPIVVQSAIASIKPWLIDVMLDGSADIGQVLAATDLNALKAESIVNFTAFQRSYSALNSIISTILGKAARFARTNRSFTDRRIGIAIDNEMAIPSLDHLSAGQSTLLAIFGTLARYGDMGHAGIELKNIEGIAVVDEIDAHLHSDLQHNALPELIKLFPKIQFIASSHSPLFPLGMQKKFGDDGFALIEMPSGLTIGAERFSEFASSFAYLQATRSFEDAVREKLKEGQKPLVLFEGETDPQYFKAAAELLGMDQLINEVEFDWIGRKQTLGAEGGGKSHLDDASKVLRNNPQLVTRKILLLYDSDAWREAQDFGDLHIRSLQKNPDNSIKQRGIENLLPETVFDERFFIVSNSKSGDDEIQRRSLNKRALCDYLCKEARNSEYFENFRTPLAMIAELLLLKNALHSS